MKRIFIILFILIICAMTNISAQENINTFEYFPIRFDKVYVYTSAHMPEVKRNTSYLMVNGKIYQLNIVFLNNRVITRSFFRIIIESDKIRLVQKSSGRNEILMIKEPQIGSKWIGVVSIDANGYEKYDNSVMAFQNIRMGYETFNDCLKVKSIKKVHSKKQKINLTIYSYYYFAKGIGLIKDVNYDVKGISNGKPAKLNRSLIWRLLSIIEKR